MKRILDSRTLKAGIGAILIFVFAGISFAGLSVSPLKQDVEVKPGKKATISIKLGNNVRSQQARACQIRLDVLDFKVTENGELLFGKKYAHKRSAVSWIKFEETDITLEPGESREVKATVTAPVDGDGDYWAAVMIQQVREKAEKGVTVNLQTASGIFVHVTRRNYVERGKIVDANIILPEFSKDQNEVVKTVDSNEKKPVLEVKAKIQNEGLIGFIGRGKVYIYSDKNRRIAMLPVHASRKQVLPGDCRWFDGILDQPLPAGDYKFRLFFDYGTESRQFTKEMKVTISQETAKRWAGKFVNDNRAKLVTKPEKIELTLYPKRFTTTNFVVANSSLSTIAGNCKIECDGQHKGWLGLTSTDFTLAPAGERSVTCAVKIPEGAKAGEYNWTIVVEMEKSGLDTESKTESYKIPVHVVVNEPVDIKRS